MAIASANFGLMSSAGASEVIVDLIEMVEDDQAFGIVVEDAGQALSLLHSRAVRSHWLRNLRAGRNRTLLWDNVRRLACALGLVHAQGLIHGSLSADVVMTQGSIGPGLPINGISLGLLAAGILGEPASGADPRADMPEGACDCHVHLIGPRDRYPMIAGRPYTPPEASVEELLALRRRLGIARNVLVQPSFYGKTIAACSMR